jgi:hypothetical protein
MEWSPPKTFLASSSTDVVQYHSDSIDFDEVIPRRNYFTSRHTAIEALANSAPTTGLAASLSIMQF